MVGIITRFKPKTGEAGETAAPPCYPGPHSAVPPSYEDLVPTTAHGTAEELMRIVESLPSYHVDQSLLERGIFTKREVRPASADPSRGADVTSSPTLFDAFDYLKISSLSKNTISPANITISGVDTGREYTSGDEVHGSYTFKNVTSRHFQFKQVLVSLEGSTSLYDTRLGITENNVFLKMCDLSNMENGVKTLSPGEIITAPFNFRFPSQLLDCNCDDGEDTHLNLPPTFGFGPSQRKNGKAPLFEAEDACPVDLSISYSINVRIIDENSQILVANYVPVRFVPRGDCDHAQDGHQIDTMDRIDRIYDNAARDLQDAKRKFFRPSDGSTQDDNDIASLKHAQLMRVNATASSTIPVPKLHENKATTLELVHRKVPKGTSPVVGKIEISNSKVPKFQIQSTGLPDCSGENVHQFEIEVKFHPSEPNYAPPNIDVFSTEIEFNTLFSSNSIPFEIDDDFLTHPDRPLHTRRRFKDLALEFNRVGSGRMLKKTAQDLNAMILMRTSHRNLAMQKSTQRAIKDWEQRVDGESGQVYWSRTVSLSVDLSRMRYHTLVPTFQSCLVTRKYNFRIGLRIGEQARTFVNVPLNVVKT